MSRDVFGPNLRRIRLQHGIAIETIAEATRVSASLWHGLEQNDFSRWPSGIYARAYLRQYAKAIGTDPDATVDEFCRWFAEGDRRAEPIVRGQSAIVGHRLKWTDDQVGLVIENDRRSERAPSIDADLPAFARPDRRRFAAAFADLAAVTGAALTIAALAPVSKAVALAGCALLYHGGALAVLGCTPAVWAIDTYLMSRHPSTSRGKGHRLVRLVRGSDRLKAS